MENLTYIVSAFIIGVGIAILFIRDHYSDVFESKLKEAKNKVEDEKYSLERRLSESKNSFEKLKEAEKDGLKREIEILKEDIAEYEEELKTQYELETKISERYDKEANKKVEEYKKVVDERIEGIVKDRVNTTVGTIKSENESLKAKNADLTERMADYKKKFEGGKVEVGFDEIKGMLLAANQNGAGIVKALQDGKQGLNF